MGGYGSTVSVLINVPNPTPLQTALWEQEQRWLVFMERLEEILVEED